MAISAGNTCGSAITLARAVSRPRRLEHVFIDYRCSDHGVIREGNTEDDEWAVRCPICGGPTFIAPSALRPRLSQEHRD
jgi:hypothetical protein